MSRKLKVTKVLAMVLGMAVPSVGQDISIGGPGEGDYSLRFFDSGSSSGQRLYWHDAEGLFHFTDSLKIDGDKLYFGSTGRFENTGYFTVYTPGHLEVGGWLFSDSIHPGADALDLGGELDIRGHVSINPDGLEDTRSLCFRDSSACDKRLLWNSSIQAFDFNDGLRVNGPIQTSAGFHPNPALSYSSIGYAGGTIGPDSDAMNGGGDLFVEHDLEVGGKVYLSSDLYIDPQPPQEQTIWFPQGGDLHANYLQWEPFNSDICGLDSAYLWHIDDNSSAGWLFTNGPFDSEDPPDIELKINQSGDVSMDGSLTENASCDLAETFIGPDLEPGTVVVLSLDAPESVVESTTSYDETVVGVVSTDPGVLLNGPTVDFYELRDEIEKVEAAYARDPSNLHLEARLQEFEALRDGWRRGTLPVALVGRVPVKVDGSYGVIRPGDALTTSHTPGHAMAMERPGPTIGVALEGFDENDTGELLMLVKPGWYVPGDWVAASMPRVDDRVLSRALEAANVRIAGLESRLLQLESLVRASSIEGSLLARASITPRE